MVFGELAGDEECRGSRKRQLPQRRGVFTGLDIEGQEDRRCGRAAPGRGGVMRAEVRLYRYAELSVRPDFAPTGSLSAAQLWLIILRSRFARGEAMYFMRTKDYRKSDMAKRWALPDRVFFACGACHILAFAFLERYGRPEMTAQWIRPTPGHTGNHVFVAFGDRVFDYHGYARREHYLAHYFARAQRRYPAWNASIVELPADVLVSEAKSRTYDGLWLREPRQFLHDALPRARAFLERFPAP